MHIWIFSQNSLIKLMKHKETVKKWFSNPEKMAFIRISSTGLEDLPVEVPDENIAIFDFADIEENKWLMDIDRFIKAEDRLEKITGIRPRYSPIKDEEAREIVEFVEKMLEKGVEVLYIHCDEGKSRSPSVAYAIAKYILEDEALAEYFDAPFYNLNKTVIKKIKNAYIQTLKEKLECNTFVYVDSNHNERHHIFSKEKSKSFCGLFEALTDTGLCDLPDYEMFYETFYDYVNTPESYDGICKTCLKLYNKKFESFYKKLKKIEKL